MLLALVVVAAMIIISCVAKADRAARARRGRWARLGRGVLLLFVLVAWGWSIAGVRIAADNDENPEPTSKPTAHPGSHFAQSGPR